VPEVTHTGLRESVYDDDEDASILRSPIRIFPSSRKRNCKYSILDTEYSSNITSRDLEEPLPRFFTTGEGFDN
jgi:hypothetical protein